MAAVSCEMDGRVAVVTLDRPEVANAIDAPTALALADAFRRFDADEDARVAVLTGANGTFCAGADLKAMRSGDPALVTRSLGTVGSTDVVLVSAEIPDAAVAAAVRAGADRAVGPRRMLLAKPVIAAVEGHAVAGGLELAAWCDLRVASEDALFGVYCRRWGIPLMDGGTIRLARLLGHSHALDLILTGRGVSGEEALRIGLANRIVARGEALTAALELAREVASKPQAALRSDRLSSYEQFSMTLADALANEYRHGMATLTTGEMVRGLEDYASGGWRGS